MGLSQQEEDALISGKFHDLPKVSSKIVRLFISSTFTDTTCERNYLIEYVFPKVRKTCQEKHGLEFQVVDMRWGISDASQDDHRTADLCLREIDACCRLSIGPSLMCFLGQKYGYCPLPLRIPVRHFNAIREALLAGTTGRQSSPIHGIDVSLLEKWYLLDENNVPPYYELRPISTIFPQFNIPENRKTVLTEWYKINSSLETVLRNGIQTCVQFGTLSDNECQDYFVSVTEKEFRHGVLNQPDPDKCALICIRRITNMAALLEHKLASQFVDMKEGAVVQRSQNRLQELKELSIPAQVNPSNIIFTNAKFIGEMGICAETHQDYLEKLGDVVYKGVLRLVDLGIMNAAILRDCPLLSEIIQHSVTCQKRCEVFKGRGDVIKLLKQHLTVSDGKTIVRQVSGLFVERQPWVIFGESGSGKTSIMAKCASEIKSWMPTKEPVVVIRFLGTTPNSCDIRLVLESVNKQICAAYHHECEEKSDYDAVSAHLLNILKYATADRPLYIFLDSLDQLSGRYNAFRLLWLPRSLPPHCHLIISTLPEKFSLLKTARQIITSDMHFIEVTPLDVGTCYDVLFEWLNKCNRSCTQQQIARIKNAFSECSLPLFVRLVFDDVTKWKSYSPIDDCKLETSIPGCINSLFDRMEIKHGKTLISHALGYLTASKTGLSDAEMNDMLSLDDDVLNEVFQYWLPPIRRIPGVLWSRICGDLELYLVEREADGITVTFWYHRQFIEVARTRYLSDPDTITLLYSNMADYYRGEWSGGRKKPFTYTQAQIIQYKLNSNADDADRLVPEQPLFYATGLKVYYNLRKLNHLPRILALCKKYSLLKQEVLFNFEWLHAKISATSLQSVLSDYARLGVLNKEAKLLFSALSLAGSSLNRHPDGLSVEILGRLISKRIIGSIDRLFADFLADVVEKGEKQCALQPLHLTFDVPSSYQIFTLEGHKDCVCDVEFSPTENVLYSVSLDGTIACWSLESGERINIIDVSPIQLHKFTDIYFSNDGEHLLCDTYTVDTPLLVIDPAINQIVKCLGNRLCPSFTSTAVTDKFVCRNGVVYDIVSGNEVATLSELVSELEWCEVCIERKNRCMLVTSGNDVLVMDLLTMLEKGRLRGENKPSYMVTCGDVAVVGYTVNTIVKLFYIGDDSSRFGNCVNTLDYRDCVEDVIETDYIYRREVSEVAVSLDQSLCLANVQRSYLIVFDLELTSVVVMNTPTAPHLTDTNYFHSRFTHDGTMVVAVVQCRHLALWQCTTGALLACVEAYHGLSMIQYLSVSPLKNLCSTVTQDTQIRIWNLDKMQLAEKEFDAEDDSVIRYDNPLSNQCLRTCGDYIFIQNFKPLVVKSSFKYINYFGLDAINVHSFTKTVILPFGEYGTLIDFDISRNMKQFCLIIKEKEAQTVLYIVSLQDGDIKCTVNMTGSFSRCEFSDRCVLVSSATTVALYDVNDGRRSLFAEQVQCCRLDPTESYVIGITVDCVNVSNRTILRQQLVRITEVDFAALTCDFLATDVVFCPNYQDRILVTSKAAEGDCSNMVVHIYDLTAQKTLVTITQVNGRIVDVASKGMCFVDHSLQVFFFDGVRKQLSSGTYVENVRLTDSGKFVYWIDQENTSVKCLDVHSGKMVAECNLHCKLVGLKLFGKGYQIGVGCKDGRLVLLGLQREHCKHHSALTKILMAANRPINWVKDEAKRIRSEHKICPASDITLKTLKLNAKVAHRITLEFKKRRDLAHLSSSDESDNGSSDEAENKSTSSQRQSVTSSSLAGDNSHRVPPSSAVDNAQQDRKPTRSFTCLLI